MATPETPALEGVDYFDGRSAEAHPVSLRLVEGTLHVRGAGIDRRVASPQVQWPERTRHGVRIAHLAGGGSLRAADPAAWDRWLERSGRREPVIVAAQQSWRWALASLLALGVLLVGLGGWGVPWAARVGVTLVPPSVDAALGARALEAIDREWMRPSALPLAEQARIRGAFENALSAVPAASVPAHRLIFRASKLGPNAFALPGGTMVLTDELVELVDADTGVITGVLAHEIGHLRHRHGMRLLLQASAIGAVAGLVIGDFSSLIAAVPVLLGEARYSRDAEREADAESVRILKAARISPAVMVRFFEKIAGWRRPAGKSGTAGGRRPPQTEAGDADSTLGISISTHPADAERVRFFRQAAGL